MQLNINKEGEENETQQEKETNAETEAKNPIVSREMDYVEECLLKNQKALAQTLDDVQMNHAEQLQQVMKNINSLMAQVNAMAIQQGMMNSRLAMLQGNGRTTPETLPDSLG